MARWSAMTCWAGPRRPGAARPAAASRRGSARSDVSLETTGRDYLPARAGAASGSRVWRGRKRPKEPHMGDGAGDDAKGRIKEAGGSLTGDDSLKREGKVDQASGKVKD